MSAPDPAYRGSDPFVFVSYSHADEVTVYQEIRHLQDQGVRVWYDATGISAGAEWNDEIAGAIRDASDFLYFISPASVASEHCRRELSFAQSLDRRIVVVHLEETEVPDGLRLSLENRQAIMRYRLEPDIYEGMLLKALEGNHPGDAGPAGLIQQGPGARSPGHRLSIAAVVLAVAAAVLTVWLLRGEPSPDVTRSQSIAVLPFVDLSPGSDQQHFGDGIAEEILDELTGLNGLHVVARTSSFAFRDDQQDLRDIAAALGVTTILEGSIRRSGDRVRITAQLINAEDGFHLWSQTYERELTDIFAIQDEIAVAVAGALGVTLGVGDVNAYSGAGTSSVEAYEAFLQARDASSTERIRLLKRAVEIDPDYAAAWAMLGQSTAATMWNSLPEKAPAIIDEAIGYLLKAVQLESNSAYAYSLLGTVNYARMDWNRSEEYFQRSLSISSDDEALRNYGNMLMRAGRSVAAISAYEATDLPTDFLPLSAYLAMRDLDPGDVDRIEPLPLRSYLEFIVALNSDDSPGVIRTISGLPRTGVAWAEFSRAVLRDLSEPHKVLAVLRTTLNDANAIWPSKYNDIALIAAYLGDPELALEAVAREFRLTTIRLFTAWYPVMREVRALPGFRELMVEINLPEYWRSHGWTDHCRPIGELDFECS